MNTKIIYLDHAATTPISTAVYESMVPFFTEIFGNPSSIHQAGHSANTHLAKARNKIAAHFGCSTEDIIFTSSGTSSDNLAIKGVFFENLKQDKQVHIITSCIEHMAVLQTCRQLETFPQCEITYLPVDQFGYIDPSDVRKNIKKNTVLVSIMGANNEIGTLQPVEEIARICKEYDIIFHSDSVQSFPWKPVNSCVDLVSISAHKFYGPKGIGILKKSSSIQLQALVSGGGQEQGLFSGTENVAYIVGMSKALEQLTDFRNQSANAILTLRDYFIEGVLTSIDGCQLIGHPSQRLPNHASFLIDQVDSQLLLNELNNNGIFVSSGSACSSHHQNHSHVLQAIGIDEQVYQGNVRFSLGYKTTFEEIDFVLDILPPLVESIRKHAPMAHISSIHI